jgi:bifunctional DNase/RNase
MIELEVKGISFGVSQASTYQLLLYSEDKDLTIPIIIGTYEAQSIAIGLEKIESPRPLTHDLINDMLLEFEKHINSIKIYDVIEGIFYSKIIFESGEEIESRTSDAIALAVRNDIRIFTTDEVINTSGIKMDFSNINVKNKESKLDKSEKEKLEKELEKAISNEDYEKAAEIKNKLNYY